MIRTESIAALGALALFTCLALEPARAVGPVSEMTTELTRQEQRAARKGQPLGDGQRGLDRIVALDLDRLPTGRGRAETVEVRHPLLVGDSLDEPADRTIAASHQPRILRGLELAIAADLAVLDDLHAAALAEEGANLPGPRLDRRLESLGAAMSAVQAHALAVHRAWRTLVAGEQLDAGQIRAVTDPEEALLWLLADESLADAFGAADPDAKLEPISPLSLAPRVEVELIAGQTDGELWVDLLVPLVHEVAGHELPLLVELRDVSVAPGERWTAQLPEDWRLADPQAVSGAFAVADGRISRTRILNSGPVTVLRIGAAR